MSKFLTADYILLVHFLFRPPRPVCAAERVKVVEDQSLFTVEAFIDETWLFQGETGRYSWFLDERVWSKPNGSKNKWGFVSVLFAWYEDDFSNLGAPPKRRFAHFEETMMTWRCNPVAQNTEDQDDSWYADFEGNLTGERFEAWLRKVCEFCQGRPEFQSRRVIFNMDNAAFHKNKLQGLSAVLKKSKAEMVNFLCTHSNNYSVDMFEDEDGDIEMTATALKNILKEEFKAINVEKLLKDDFQYGVRWTPPYWPQFQPFELGFCNQKQDYRSWKSVDKSPDVGQDMQRFWIAVTRQDVEGWVAHTDKFSKAVDDEVKGVAGDRSRLLDQLTIDLLA